MVKIYTNMLSINLMKSRWWHWATEFNKDEPNIMDLTFYIWVRKNKEVIKGYAICKINKCTSYYI